MKTRRDLAFALLIVNRLTGAKQDLFAEVTTDGAGGWCIRLPEVEGSPELFGRLDSSPALMFLLSHIGKVRVLAGEERPAVADVVNLDGSPRPMLRDRLARRHLADAN